MNYKRQLQGLKRVKWETKTDKQKAKYLEKKLDLLGYKVPKYIKNGKITERQLRANLSKIEKGLNTRIQKDDGIRYKKFSLETLLNNAVAKYNKKLGNIENKLIKELNLSEQEKKYLQGNDIFFASRKKSFFRDELTTKKLNIENMEFQSKREMKNFLNQIEVMTDNLMYKEYFNSLVDDTKSNIWFDTFLSSDFNAKLSEQDKRHLWYAFDHLTPLQKELFIKGELDKLKEKYESLSDGDILDTIAINVFNRILTTIEDYR